jgi:hypothetical protein
MKPLQHQLKLCVGILILCGFLTACNNPPGDQKDQPADTTKTKSTDQPTPNAVDTSMVTLAAIRETSGDSIELLFNERQEIFTVKKSDALVAKRMNILRKGLSENAPVKIAFDLRRRTITSVDTVSTQELNRFKELRKNITLTKAPVKVDLRRLDTAVFNDIQKIPFPEIFRLCSNVVPDYATAKAIFDDCAAQACHLPSPPSPCIPFQYVRDGCYARAHKMREIIRTKYNYCVEKVFSFANVGTQRLAVRANKWGGCCVTWWYHVAPLIRVKTVLKLGYRNITLNLAYVIDPSMFNQPVLLSTWLAAQKETSCYANANVSSYSIQPGSAYWPANNAGTMFDTDPSLTSTNYYLNLYRTLTTCP